MESQMLNKGEKLSLSSEKLFIGQKTLVYPR